jgi:hypothetical protein
MGLHCHHCTQTYKNDVFNACVVQSEPAVGLLRGIRAIQQRDEQSENICWGPRRGTVRERVQEHVLGAKEGTVRELTIRPLMLEGALVLKNDPHRKVHWSIRANPPSNNNVSSLGLTWGLVCNRNTLTNMMIEVRKAVPHHATSSLRICSKHSRRNFHMGCLEMLLKK